MDGVVFSQMERITKIINNKTFRKCIKRINELEKNRKFCCHDIDHYLAVARISYILNIENNLNIHKEIIYSTALLHDIGRHKQYENNIPHEIASSSIAEGILKDCDFITLEIETIKDAIENHREEKGEVSSLNSIIYTADKLSRNCFLCSAKDECNWPENMKNSTIQY